MIPTVAWTISANTTSPLLLVATESEVNAFRVKQVAASPENSHP